MALRKLDQIDGKDHFPDDKVLLIVDSAMQQLKANFAMPELLERASHCKHAAGSLEGGALQHAHHRAPCPLRGNCHAQANCFH